MPIKNIIREDRVLARQVRKRTEEEGRQSRIIVKGNVVSKIARK